RVGAIVLWKSRTRDDPGFFVHDVLHESARSDLIPGRGDQRSVDGSGDTAILDLMLLRGTRGNTARNVARPSAHPSARRLPALSLNRGKEPATLSWLPPCMNL
ncbi:MAG TPA: hypothetical protein VE667_04525, partial [Xanthobacteraceae bacterium]|nr:hypothetical protein [Xanthobacteraceae bacterium]